MKTIKTLIACAVALTSAHALSTAASASDLIDTMQAALGNTIRVHAASGAYDVHYKADGTFTNSQGAAGTWRIQGNTLTLTVNGADVGSATIPAGKKIGDHFDMLDETGQKVSVEIVAGQ